MAATRCTFRDAVGQQCQRPDGHSPEFTNWFGDTRTDPHGAHDFGGVFPDARRPHEWARYAEGSQR